MKIIYHKIAIIYILLTLIMIACDPKPVGNQEAIKEEIENRKIKRVTKADILREASEKGDLISSAAQTNLIKILLEKIQNAGVIEAVEHCNVVAIPLVDSLSEVYGAKIRRVSSKVRNARDKPDAIEAEILEAYHYAVENNFPAESNVQEINDKVVLYTKPILLSNRVCLNCHGNIGSDILREDHKSITSLYPEDSATGYKIGDLTGMWSIRLLKKNLIQNMD